MFDASQKWILIVCAGVIVIGLAILAFDRYVIRADQTEPDSTLDDVASTLQMQLNEDASDRLMLTALLLQQPELVGRDPAIESILQRRFDGATLSAIDFTSQDEAVYGAQGTRHDVAVGRLAIVFDLDTSTTLPAWNSLSGAPAPAPPFTEDALRRLNLMEEFDMAAGEQQVMFVSRSEGWALMRAAERSTSPEFGPGLMNSALRIDLQRAIDVVNALTVELPEIPPIYRIDVDTNIQVNLDTGISERLQNIRETADADRQQRQETMQSQAEANQAARESLSATLAENQRANAEKLRERSEQQRAAREKLQLEQREKTRQTIERLNRRSEEAKAKARAAADPSAPPSEPDER